MEKLTIQEWKVKIRSKREVYNLFYVQGNVLPSPIEQCNHQYKGDSGRKKQVKCKYS